VRPQLRIGPTRVPGDAVAYKRKVRYIAPGRYTMERQVAELRTVGLTLQAIAKRLGVTSERVRQIEARLMSRAWIRHW
jgi:hypothetical protein